MSIQIGQRSLQETTRERIFVQSVAESNLIILKSGLTKTNFLIQDYTFGQTDSNFVFSQSNSDAPLLTLNSNISLLATGLFVSESVTVQSNVVVVGNLDAGLASAGRIIVTDPGPLPSAAPLFSVRNTPGGGSLDLMTVTANGRLLMRETGAIGIGTAIPIHTIHTEGSLFVRNNIIASNIQPADNASRSIRFATDKIRLTGATEVAGDLNVTGAFALGNAINVPNVIATSLISGPRLELSGSNESNVMFGMTYTGPIEGFASDGAPEGYSNLIDVRIRPADSNIHAFTINRLGHVGIGTDQPRAVLDIRDVTGTGGTGGGIGSNSLGYGCNMVYFRGGSDYDLFVVNRHANVGMGTSTPNHALHIVNVEHLSPIIGVYNSNLLPEYIAAGCNLAPIMYAYSNQSRVFAVAGDGRVTIGPGASNEAISAIKNVYLDVHGEGFIDCLSARCITGLPNNGCNVDFLGSAVRGVSNLRVGDTQANRVDVTNLIANYMYTSNWEILGMQCFDSNMFGLSQFHVRTSNLLFTGQQVYFDESLSNVQNRNADPRVIGKLAITVRDSSASSCNVSRGIYVTGLNNASVLVHSCNAAQVPSYELQSATTRAQMGLRNRVAKGDSVFFKYVGADGLYDAAATNPAEFYRSGAVTLSPSEEFYVSPTGTLGLQLGNEVPVQTLDMRGGLRARTITSPVQPLLFVNATTTLVGVGTETPTSKLHVQGTFYASNAALFGEKVTIGATNQTGAAANMLTVWGSNGSAGPDAPLLVVASNTGYVGIGTNAPRFKMDIFGDLNFNGALYQNGGAYVSSQWTTSGLNPSNIYYALGNVGIGTLTPTERVHVVGNVFATGSFMSTSDRTFKKDLAVIGDPLEKIASLTGYTFQRKKPDEELTNAAAAARETGLIAQDVLGILPEAVTRQSDGMLSIAYGNLAGLFVEAIKELKKECGALKERVAALEALAAAERAEYF